MPPRSRHRNPAPRAHRLNATVKSTLLKPRRPPPKVCRPPPNPSPKTCHREPVTKYPPRQKSAARNLPPKASRQKPPPKPHHRKPATKTKLKKVAALKDYPTLTLSCEDKVNTRSLKISHWKTVKTTTTSSAQNKYSIFTSAQIARNA